MDTSNITRGDDLMLFDSNGQSIAFATNHTLTISADANEISCKDSGLWKTSVVTKMGWEIQSENLYLAAAYDDLFSKMIARTPIDVYFGKTTNGVNTNGVDSPTSSYTKATSGCYTGKVIITSLTLNASSGDNATYSVTLTGVGEFQQAQV